MPSVQHIFLRALRSGPQPKPARISGSQQCRTFHKKQGNAQFLQAQQVHVRRAVLHLVRRCDVGLSDYSVRADKMSFVHFKALWVHQDVVPHENHLRAALQC